VVVGEGFGYTVVELVVGDRFVPVEIPIFALANRECRGCIVAR
jgi:hypothetical protein